MDRRYSAGSWHGSTPHEVTDNGICTLSDPAPAIPSSSDHGSYKPLRALTLPPTSKETPPLGDGRSWRSSRFFTNWRKEKIYVLALYRESFRDLNSHVCQATYNRKRLLKVMGRHGLPIGITRVA